MISFLPQMWSPPVMTWTPARNSSSASEGMRPLPPARFSPLAMTQSTSSLRQNSPMRFTMIERPGLPTTSPIARILTFMRGLPRVLHEPALAHDRHADLSRIRQLLLDLLGDVAGQRDGLRVADLVAVHEHADLAAGLDRVDAGDAGLVLGERLELLDALDVTVERLAARAGAGRGDRVGRGGDHGVHVVGVGIVVVVRRGVDDLLGLLEPLEQLAADDRVGAL